MPGVTENKILRLAFHDCVGYSDGGGGVCDGCLNWKGMGVKNPPAHTREENYYHMDASNINETDNNGLAAIVDKLEIIYTTIDWPFKVFSPSAGYRA